MKTNTRYRPICFGMMQRECVRVEEKSEGLNPSEVPGPTSWPVANESSIDLNVLVRD